MLHANIVFVNRVADYIGSGTGTARFYGVPGVDDYRHDGFIGRYAGIYGVPGVDGFFGPGPLRIDY